MLIYQGRSPISWHVLYHARHATLKMTLTPRAGPRRPPSLMVRRFFAISFIISPPFAARHEYIEAADVAPPPRCRAAYAAKIPASSKQLIKNSYFARAGRRQRQYATHEPSPSRRCRHFRHAMITTLDARPGCLSYRRHYMRRRE